MAGADETLGPQLDYDHDADVLYVSFGPPRPAVGEHYDDDIILLHALDTGALVGITVVGYVAIGGAEELLRRLDQLTSDSSIAMIRANERDLRDLVPA